MAVNDYYWELAELNPDAVVYEEFESAYMGIAVRVGLKPVALYDTETIINTVGFNLMQDKEFMEKINEEHTEEQDKVDALYDEASQHFHQNIEGGIFGKDNENGPIFLQMPDVNFDERIEEDE